MKRFVTYSFISWLLVTGIGIQESYAQGIDSMINIYGEYFPQEHIYIHFDKPAYNNGETIWFKAYLYAGIGPSGISKNFYTELLDPSGKVVQQKIFPIFEGSSAGHFDLPENNTNQSLIFRAYTTWMLNFDTAFLYTRSIRVLDVKAPATAAASQPKNTISLKFFPEGGDLVNGLESVVAFKANDIYGIPYEVSGVIKDAAGAKVTDFSSEHDGMGKISLTPAAGKTYYAEWTDDKKQLQKTPLPKALTTGAVLHAMQHEKIESFVVKRDMNAPDNFKTMHLLGYFNQQVVYKAKLNMQETIMISGAIPLTGLPTGMLQMTLFDANWNAVAERITFINKEDYSFTTKVTPEVTDIKKRGKNIIVVEVPDTLKSNLSLSITDAGLSKIDPDADNIISRLLLSGNLKGYVHNPYYYFLGNDEIIRGHVDLLVLTHGWRRFKWEDLAAGKLPEIKYPRENYLSVKAQLAGVAASQIPSNTALNIFLEAKDSSRQLFSLTVDTNGVFAEDGLIFFDTVKVFYQFNNNKHLANKGVLNFSNGTWKSSRSIKPDSSWKIPMILDTALLNRGLFFAKEADRIKPDLDRKVKVLEAVTVRARTRSKQEQMDETYTSGFFSGGDAYSFDLLNDPMANSALSIFQYLQGRVAGLQINTSGGTPQLTWRQATPTLFLNEMQLDASAIQNIPVSDIAYVKVFRPPFFGAAGGGAGGAIAIYTRKGGEQSAGSGNVGGLEKGILVGYAPPKEFYLPDYSKESPLNDVEDVRSTLYWAPYILTDTGNRRITIQFYNNDISNRLRIVLEGMNEEGRLTRVEKILE